MDRQAYLDRKGERLVVQGFRHWLSGYEFGDVACWEQAWTLFTQETGAVNAGALVSQLHYWVKAIRERAIDPVRCLTCQCRYLCREECLCVGMISALQHGDEESAALCAATLVGEKADDVIAAARQFAKLLNDNGARLLEVPSHVIISIISGERAASTPLH
jgi:predicted Zn-ribbon and HTH transcriptional regulator